MLFKPMFEMLGRFVVAFVAVVMMKTGKQFDDRKASCLPVRWLLSPEIIVAVVDT